MKNGPAAFPQLHRCNWMQLRTARNWQARRSGTWWWPRPAVGIGASEQTSVQIPNVGEKILTGAWNP